MIADRIKFILEKHQISAANLAEKIGVQRSAISHILSLRNKPSLEMVARILETFPDIDADWFLTGKDDMDQLKLFDDSASSSKQEKKQTKPKINEDNSKRVFHADKFNQIQEAFNVDINDIDNMGNQQNMQSTNASNQIKAMTTKKQTSIQNENPNDFSLENILVNEISQNNTNPKISKETSTNNKKIDKIIIFYDDKTFSVYQPE